MNSRKCPPAPKSGTRLVSLSLYGYRITMQRQTLWTSDPECTDCYLGNCECVLKGSDVVKKCPSGATLYRFDGTPLKYAPKQRIA